MKLVGRIIFGVLGFPFLLIGLTVGFVILNVGAGIGFANAIVVSLVAVKGRPANVRDLSAELGRTRDN